MMLTVMMTSYSTSIAQNWLCLRIFEVGVSCCRGHPLDHTDVKENSAMMLRITKRLKTYKEQTCWQHFSVLHSVCSNWKAASDVPSPSPASGCVVKMTMAKQHIPTSQKLKKHDDDEDEDDSSENWQHSFSPLHAGGHSQSLGLVRSNRRRKNIFVRYVRPDNVLRMGCTIYLGTDLWFIWKRPSGFKYKSIEDKENSQRHLKILTSAWSF